MQVRKFGIHLPDDEGRSGYSFCNGTLHIELTFRLEGGRIVAPSARNLGKCDGGACQDGKTLHEPHKLPRSIQIAFGLLVKVPVESILISERTALGGRVEYAASPDNYTSEGHRFTVMEWAQFAGEYVDPTFLQGQTLLSPGGTTYVVEKWTGWPGEHLKEFSVTNVGGKAVVELLSKSRQEIEKLLAERQRERQVEAAREARLAEGRKRVRRDFAREQRQYLLDLGFSFQAASQIFDAAGPGLVRDSVDYFVELLQAETAKTVPAGVPGPVSRIRTILSVLLEGVDTNSPRANNALETDLGLVKLGLFAPDHWSMDTKHFFCVLRAALSIAKAGGIPKPLVPNSFWG